MNTPSNKPYIAHVRTSDKAVQSLEHHLLEVAEIAKKLAAKINAAEADVILIQYRNTDTTISAKTLNLADNPLLTTMLDQITLLTRPEQHGQAISAGVHDFYSK